MPSRMTTISNCSFMRERCDRSKNGLLVLISWQMVRGDTKKSWSAPVPKPTSSSHWSRGRNSPSGVCRDWKTRTMGSYYINIFISEGTLRIILSTLSSRVGSEHRVMAVNNNNLNPTSNIVPNCEI